MKKALPGRSEFQRVYRRGKRYEGACITTFVLSNGELCHRLGVTASRKTLGNAVNRNRAKRLMREAFRLNHNALQSLQRKYDWVLNANRVLLDFKVSAPVDELAAVIERVAKEEGKSAPLGS